MLTQKRFGEPFTWTVLYKSFLKKASCKCNIQFLLRRLSLMSKQKEMLELRKWVKTNIHLFISSFLGLYFWNINHFIKRLDFFFFLSTLQGISYSQWRELGKVRMAETDAIGKTPLLRSGLLVPSTKKDPFVYILVKTNLAKKSWNALLGMWVF